MTTVNWFVFAITIGICFALVVDSRSISSLDSDGAEIAGEDTHVPRRSLAEFLGTVPEPRPTNPRISVTIRQRPMETERPAPVFDDRLIDEYVEDPFEKP
ncbi:hypothetical protein M3Y98_00797200 [Aphelenchoides besseyi]|nr:hypothetical protein M3Y98_00797200 [Aphelenchoides besseyi]KAI6212001.1 hypothetical protein M3Y96_00494000 [Aphelenchoides besseyi]